MSRSDSSSEPRAHHIPTRAAKDHEIAVVGLGHVGLPLAIFLARAGFQVRGVDIREDTVRSINDGVLTIDEAELKVVFLEPGVRKNLVASNSVQAADVFIICVPTPLEPRRKVADLRTVVSSVESILPHLRRGNMVILESTVPPLTCRRVLTPLIEAKGKLQVNVDVDLVHCPERIFPGNIAREIVGNDRVIGSLSSLARERAKELYSSFVKGAILLTDDITAELAKVMENSYRDVNIALANEFAQVAETLGVDIHAAIKIANAHPRVRILRPGVGVGGHCIPKDPWFLAQVDPAHTQLIQLARAVNDSMPERAVGKIRKAVADLPSPEIVLVGIAYKADTGDVLESPAIRIATMLREDGFRVRHFDPLVKGAGYASLAHAARGADLLAILVPHRVVIEELEGQDAAIRASMRTPRILRF